MLLANCLKCYATVPYLPNGERPKFCTSCGESMSVSVSSKPVKRKIVEEDEEESCEDISSLKLNMSVVRDVPRKIRFGDLANSMDDFNIGARGAYNGDPLKDMDAQIKQSREEIN